MTDLTNLSFSIETQGNITIICKQSLPQLIQISMNRGPLGVSSSMKGRSSIRLIEPDMVVRTLMHGGLLRHITKARFFSPNRTIRELKINSFLASHGIPTPEILAVRFIKNGLFYSIDVISRLVPNSVDMLDYLREDREDSSELLYKTGALIRKIHDLGVYCADLHIKNILLSSSKELWILDMDKAYHFQALPDILRQLNLRRFIRSVRKWQKKNILLTENTWLEEFMHGYNKGSG